MSEFQKKPCIECPFRKQSLPGYLGGYTIEETMAVSLSEQSFHCHMTREGNDNHYLGEPKECAGRLLFASNVAKSFRDKDLEAMRVATKVYNPNHNEEILGFDMKSHHTKYE